MFAFPGDAHVDFDLVGGEWCSRWGWFGVEVKVKVEVVFSSME